MTMLDATAAPLGADARAFVLLKSRRRLDLLNPDPQAWTDDDLAAGLSRTMRWGGASQWGHPLSVAQHSLTVLAIREAEGPLTAQEGLRELLHDATEFMLGWDCIAPLKAQLGAPFCQLEACLQMPGRDRTPGERTRARVFAGTRDVPDGAAPPRLRRLGSRRRSLARGLPHRWRRRPRTASSLSHDGVAGRGTAQRPAGRRDAVCAALREGRPGGGAVRFPARPPDHARHRVHGHDQPLFRGRRRPDARTARLLQGPPARSQPDDPGRAARRRRPPRVHRDVA